jgi:hypothetical protein
MNPEYDMRNRFIIPFMITAVQPAFCSGEKHAGKGHDREILSSNA